MLQPDARERQHEAENSLKLDKLRIEYEKRERELEAQVRR